MMIVPSKPDTRPSAKALPAPSHPVHNDFNPAHHSTERHEPRNGPRYDPTIVTGERMAPGTLALPAPGPHVHDDGRH
jgi:hypothetical protein